MSSDRVERYVSRAGRRASFVTLDGSTVTELAHPGHDPVGNQSLALAEVEVGGRTRLHRHGRTEELYHVLDGQGEMTLGERRFAVGAGDTVIIPPGTAHAIENTGGVMLRFLCACAPAYSDRDTELLA